MLTGHCVSVLNYFRRKKYICELFVVRAMRDSCFLPVPILIVSFSNSRRRALGDVEIPCPLAKK